MHHSVTLLCGRPKKQRRAEHRGGLAFPGGGKEEERIREDEGSEGEKVWVGRRREETERVKGEREKRCGWEGLGCTGWEAL